MINKTKAQAMRLSVKLLFLFMPPSPPVIVPTRTDFRHAVIIRRMIRMSGVASVVEGAATSCIDSDEEDKDQNINDRQLFPVKTDLLKNTSFASITLVA